jgi:hypothetical protein
MLSGQRAASKRSKPISLEQKILKERQASKPNFKQEEFNEDDDILFNISDDSEPEKENEI